MSPFQNLTLAFFSSSHKMPFVEHAVMSLANWLRLKDKDFISGISWQIYSWICVSNLDKRPVPFLKLLGMQVLLLSLEGFNNF